MKKFNNYIDVYGTNIMIYIVYEYVSQVRGIGNLFNNIISDLYLLHEIISSEIKK